MTDALTSNRAFRFLEIALIWIVVAVTLLNGSEFYLKRVGLIDRAAYGRYLELHVKGGPHARGLLPTAQYVEERPVREYLFRSEGRILLLKLLKDAVVIALLLLAAFSLARSGALPPIRDAWPGYLLAGSIVISFTTTAIEHGLLLPLAGLRAFAFVLLALLLAGCRSLRETLGSALASAALLLLGFEIAVVGFEAIQGLPIYGYLTVSPDIPGRLVGTFVRPNTLGVFAVLAFAFCLSFTPGNRWRRLLLFLVVALVVLSSSATGLVVLGALGAGAALKRFGRRALVPLAVMIVAWIALLPVLTGRPKLFDSVAGRLVDMRYTYDRMEGVEVVAGRAFGAGTNTAHQLFRAGGPMAVSDRSSVFTSSSDSLPSMLLIGTGLTGLLAFYVLLLWAAVRTPQYWPFWVALFLTSLSMKIVEIFPVSLFLAAALAVALATREPVERPGY